VGGGEGRCLCCNGTQREISTRIWVGFGWWRVGG